jgi:hypothetical protein
MRRCPTAGTEGHVESECSIFVGSIDTARPAVLGCPFFLADFSPSNRLRQRRARGSHRCVGALAGPP